MEEKNRRDDHAQERSKDDSPLVPWSQFPPISKRDHVLVSIAVCHR